VTSVVNRGEYCSEWRTGAGLGGLRTDCVLILRWAIGDFDGYAEQMRVISLSAFGGADALKIGEAERPEPGEGEVLIRVAAAGINRADLLQRQGHYPPPVGASEILGMEISGEIVSRGPGAQARWKTGDHVCALVPGGGYAEYCVAHGGCCLPAPENMTLAEAASLPEATFTVWANLFEPRRLFAGDRFLIQGGTSGIGTLAIQASRAFGATVAATAGSAEKCRFLLELGCERAFNYREEDWAAGALEWANGRGVDVILDMVGGDYFAKHLKLLAKDGRLVHIATTHGNEVDLDLRTVMLKRLVITGSTLRSRSVAEKTRLRDGVEEHLWPLVQAGRIRPVVDQVFNLQEAARAHQRMESSLHIGKIVLKVA
jgi:NADPH:quinone reductase